MQSEGVELQLGVDCGALDRMLIHGQNMLDNKDRAAKSYTGADARGHTTFTRNNRRSETVAERFPLPSNSNDKPEALRP